MKSNFLTICIPTYNRANILDFLLNELSNQIEFNNFKDIKVVVADNSLNDETNELLISKDYYNNIVYKKNKTNLGAFGNLMEVTSMLDSEFVWVLGDDDFITPNAVKNVYYELQKCNDDIDFVLLNSCSFDSSLSYIKNPNESPNLKTQIYPKRSQKLLSDFNFGALGHFSRLVFRQKVWLNENPIVHRESHEIYPHLKSILKLASQNNVYFFDKISIINSKRSPEASTSWSGYVAIYWTVEYLNLLELAVNKYGYPSKVKNLKYKNLKKIILAYVKINIQKEQYQKIIFRIKQQNNDFFYWFFMYPIEILLYPKIIRKLIKSISEKNGITFHNINIEE